MKGEDWLPSCHLPSFAFWVQEKIGSLGQDLRLSRGLWREFLVMPQGGPTSASLTANQTREQEKAPFAATLGSPEAGPAPLQTPVPSHMERGCVFF